MEPGSPRDRPPLTRLRIAANVSARNVLASAHEMSVNGCTPAKLCGCHGHVQDQVPAVVLLSMACVKCGHENREDDLFCSGCGARFLAGDRAVIGVSQLERDLGLCLRQGLDRLDYPDHFGRPIDLPALTRIADGYVQAEGLAIRGRSAQIKRLLWDALGRMQGNDASGARFLRLLFFGETPWEERQPSVLPVSPLESPDLLRARAKEESGLDEGNFHRKLAVELPRFSGQLVQFSVRLGLPVATGDGSGHLDTGGFPAYRLAPPGSVSPSPARPSPALPGPPQQSQAGRPAKSRTAGGRDPRRRRVSGAGRQPISVADPDEALRRQVQEAVKPGLLAFNPPPEMMQGQQERVEVSIARSAELRDAMIVGLRGRGAPEFEELGTSSSMTVELRGSAFEIDSLSATEQLVAPLARWEFDVRPLRFGVRTLTLCICLRIDSPSVRDGRISVPVLEKQIRIQVDVVYGTRRFVTANWQWLIASVIALGGALAAWAALVR
jgi:hypothetical protein